MDQLPRLGKRVLIYLLLLTCNYVVSVRISRFPLPLGAWDGYVITVWHYLSLPYNYFENSYIIFLERECNYSFLFRSTRQVVSGV